MTKQFSKVLVVKLTNLESQVRAEMGLHKTQEQLNINRDSLGNCYSSKVAG